MSRRNSKKSQDYQLQFIRSGYGKGDNFVRVYRSLFYSNAYTGLSPTAKDVYMAILLQCSTDTKIRCVYPFRMYSQRYDKRTFQRAKRELIEAGFITEVSSRTKENIYTLSDKWKESGAVEESGSVNPAFYNVTVKRK